MNEIERRFMPIDKYLSKYLREYNKINKNTQDTLQNIFNELDITYSDLNKPIPENKKNRLNRRLEKLLEKKEDNYMWFLLNQTLNKRKITYRELLEMYILSAYYEERKSLDDYDNVFFYSALETTYNQAIADIRKLKRKRKLKNEIFNWSILYTILNIPLLYGTKEAYLYGLALTNANEMYRKCLNDIQSQKELDIDNIGMQELLLKQRNKILSINDNKYSGAIENMVESYSNLAYLQCGLDNDVRKCKFIAQMDTRTTRMCESLNNQTFYLTEINKYKRYSDIDKRIKTFHTRGLVLGDNLPPITNHFHWCRSTITYQIEDENIEERVRGSMATITETDAEQYDRYKMYYGNKVPDTLELFVEMKNKNIEKWHQLRDGYTVARKRYEIIHDIANTKIKNKQLTHIISESKYKEGNSFFYLPKDEVYALIKEKKGTGELFSDKNGTYKEIIVNDKNIGRFIRKDEEGIIIENKETDTFIIIYSKDGIHAYPVDSRGDLNE